MSPAQIMRYYRGEMDSFPPSPMRSNHDSPSPSNSNHSKAKVHATSSSSSSSSIHRREVEMGHLAHDQQQQLNEPTSAVVGSALAQHEIEIEHSKEFSFDRTT